MLKRLTLLALLLPLPVLAQQGPGPVPYRGINNWPLIFGTDNTYDIGASGATRPRTGYFGTSVITPALTVSGLTAGRAVYAGASGLLSVDAGVTYDGTTFESIDQTNISGPDSATNVEIGSAGNDANAGTGGTSTVIGNAATNSSNGADNTIIGSSANVTTSGASRATAIGKSSRVGGASIRSIAVGSNALADASFTVVIGESAVAQGQQAIVLGYLAASGTDTNVFVAGSGSAAMTDVYFGEGRFDTTAAAWNLRGTAGSGADNAGGRLNIVGGRATGTAAGGDVVLQASVPAASSSTQQAVSDRMFTRAAPKALTESSATAIAQVSVASGAYTGGELRYTIFASDGTDHQARHGRINFSAVNKAGTETCVMAPGTVDQTTDGNAGAISSGTLTYAITCTTTPTNGVQFEVSAVSSLTQTTLQAYYSIHLDGPGTVTPQ